MPHFHRSVLSITALAGILILQACSQASPDTAIDPHLARAPAPTPTKRTAGTAADSVNGMQGHTFGEPLRNFPGLLLLEQDDELGVRWYKPSPGQERSWFGKHAKEYNTYYQFQDGRFAMFRAISTDLGANPAALREELCSLFGPGKRRKDLKGILEWEGERVRATYSEKKTRPVQYWLQVYSKPLRQVQEAKQRAVAGE